MSNQSLLPGTSLGRYTIERRIARGGFGEVYLARDTRLDREVAIKTLHPWLARDEANGRDYVARFQREARAMARLRHPNIAQVFDVDEDAGLDGPYLSMEYLPGGSLADHLSGRPLPEAEALSIARQILSGLVAAHAAGLIHRDIKPANALRAEDGRWVLADFGLAKLLEAGARSSLASAAAFGTPMYMAPEQINGERVDGRCDLYAVGGLLFEMLAGHPPFQAPNVVALLMQQLNEPAPDLARVNPRVSPATARLVARLLAKRPADRPPSAAAVLAELRGEEPTATIPSGRWIWWALGSAAALGIGLILAAALAGAPVAPASLAASPSLAGVTAAAAPPAAALASSPSAAATSAARPLGGLDTGSSPPSGVRDASNGSGLASSTGGSAIGRPTATLSPDTSSATSTPVPSRLPATAVTPRPVATSVLIGTRAEYPAPEPLGPDPTRRFEINETPELRWTSVGALQANDFYRVLIKYKPGYDIMCVKETSAKPNAYVRTEGAPDDTYTWTVDVVRVQALPRADSRFCEGSLVSAGASRQSNLKWNSGSSQQSSQPPSDPCQPPLVWNPVLKVCQ